MSVPRTSSYLCSCGAQFNHRADVEKHMLPREWKKAGHGKTCPDPTCGDEHGHNTRRHWEKHLPEPLRAPKHKCTICSRHWVKPSGLKKHLLKGCSVANTPLAWHCHLGSGSNFADPSDILRSNDPFQENPGPARSQCEERGDTDKASAVEIMNDWYVPWSNHQPDGDWEHPLPDLGHNGPFTQYEFELTTIDHVTPFATSHCTSELITPTRPRARLTAHEIQDVSANRGDSTHVGPLLELGLFGQTTYPGNDRSENTSLELKRSPTSREPSATILDIEPFENLALSRDTTFPRNVFLDTATDDHKGSTTSRTETMAQTEPSRNRYSWGSDTIQEYIPENYRS